ncbi:MAG: radical SAM family heme chaperone HemW [Planctomycetota bacterium]|jgi:oxygen-independent coproporphyrinogen-3 oxidase
MKSASSNAGLYIHIPYCQKKCPYCAFYSEPIEQHKPEALIDALFMELERYAVTEPLETIYIGGGSPTCLPGYLLTETVVSLVSQYKDAAEFTIECNPAQANETTLKQLRTLGVNRLSIGAQSFDANELKTLGRIHSPEQIAEAVRAGKAAGFDNIGLDLIFGVPGSTMDTWRYSLECAAALDVQHISAYSLTIEKATPFDRVFRAGQLAMIDEAAEREMFAQPGFECQHNLRYWKNLAVVGIGPAAAGWYKGKRTTNIPDIAAYIEKTENHQFAYTEEHAPAPEQIACETAVLGLRMTNGIDMHEFEKQTGFDLIMLFGSAIKQHCASGLLECTADNHCRLTEKGFSYADTVAGDFASLD